MRALTEAAPTLCNRLLHNCRGRNVCLLESVRDPAARRWYVRQAIESGRARFDKRGLSRVILDEDWRQSVSRRRRADVTESGHTTRKRAFVDCLALPGPSPPGEAVAADLVRSTLRLWVTVQIFSARWQPRSLRNRPHHASTDHAYVGGHQHARRINFW